MSKIDWEKRIIIGKSGAVYKILPEKISVGRWPKYELWSTLISTRMDMDTFLKTLNSVINRVNKAQSFGEMIQPYTELTDLRNGIVKYNETGRPQLVEFAALFCLKCDKEGNIIEDVGEITEDVIREKYNDWKEIDMSDFFLLVSRHIPSFQENYRLEVERQRNQGSE
jgi:thiol-disulfide isomerase/thioredoxin